MGAVFFYHLTRSPLEAALGMLIDKALQQGWRVGVRGRTSEVLGRLDRVLWTNPPDSFLPHGLAGGPHDADQPVLLTTEPTLANGACCLMAVEGADVAPAEVVALERTCILFDGGDDAAVEGARAMWRMMKAAGVAAEYWSQREGPWRCEAKSGQAADAAVAVQQDPAPSVRGPDGRR